MSALTVLSARLKERRKAAGLTQEQVAAAMNLEIGTISGYEIGRRRPDSDKLPKLARVLRTSADYLLGNTNDPGMPSTGYQDPPNPRAVAKAAILEAPDGDEALERLQDWRMKYKVPFKEVAEMLPLIHQKYGDMFPKPREGGKAAHGPKEPGTGALDKTEKE